MSDDDPDIRRSGRFRGLDIFFLTDGKDRGSYDPGICRYGRDPHRDHKVRKPRSKSRHDSDGQKCLRNSQQHVHKSHDKVIYSLPVITRNRSQGAACDHSNPHRHEAYQQRSPCSIYDTAEDISSKLIRAKQVLCIGMLERIRQILLCIIIWCNKIGKDSHYQQQEKDYQPENCHLIAA